MKIFYGFLISLILFLYIGLFIPLKEDLNNLDQIKEEYISYCQVDVTILFSKIFMLNETPSKTIFKINKNIKIRQKKNKDLEKEVLFIKKEMVFNKQKYQKIKDLIQQSKTEDIKSLLKEIRLLNDKNEQLEKNQEILEFKLKNYKLSIDSLNYMLNLILKG